MTQGSGGSPVLFESINANGAGGWIDVGMVDFGQKVSSGRGGGEVGPEDQFELKVTGVIGCLFGSFNFGLRWMD